MLRRSALLLATPLARLIAWGVLTAGLTFFEPMSLRAPAQWRSSVLLDWARANDPLVVFFTAARMATVGLAWYLLLLSALSLMAATLGSVRLMRLTQRLAPSMFRPLLQTLAGVGVSAVLSTAMPAAASAPVPPALVVDAAPPTPHEPRASEPLPPALTVRRGQTPNDAPGTWQVRPGDHFWSIAETVATRGGGTPDDARVARYWQRLVDANRAQLADPANEDLLFPGQILDLPPT